MSTYMQAARAAIHRNFRRVEFHSFRASATTAVAERSKSAESRYTFDIFQQPRIHKKGGTQNTSHSNIPRRSLADLVWKGFHPSGESDGEIRHFPFHSLPYLETMLGTLWPGIEGGAIILRENGEPVLMAPYFVGLESAYDGLVPKRVRNFMLQRSSMPQFQPYQPKSIPLAGLHTVFIGNPHHPPSRIFTKTGGLEILERPEVQTIFLSAIEHVVRSNDAHLSSFFCFRDDPTIRRIMESLEHRKGPCWPDMRLNLAHAYRKSLAHRRAEANLALASIQTQIEALNQRLQTLEKEWLKVYPSIRSSFVQAFPVLVTKESSKVEATLTAILALVGQSESTSSQVDFSSALRSLCKKIDIDFEQMQSNHEVSRQKFAYMGLALQLESHRKDLSKAEKKRSSAESSLQAIVDELSTRELRPFPNDLDDLIQALPNADDRSNIKRNWAEIVATTVNAGEQPSGRKTFEWESCDYTRVNELIGPIQEAYRDQYRRGKIKWIPMTEEYLLSVVQSGTGRISVLWNHLPDGSREFVAFKLIFINRGTLINHRIGINPKYTADTEIGKKYIVWNRIVGSDLEECIQFRIPIYSCCWTGYATKENWGMEPDNMFNYRRSWGIPILGRYWNPPRFEALVHAAYAEISRGVSDPAILKEY